MTVQPKADQPKAETGAVPKVRHQLIENRGASLWLTNSARVETGNKEKILTGTSVPLDLPANGRPRPSVRANLKSKDLTPDAFSLCVLRKYASALADLN
jgi:hypothetical protein